MNTCVIALGANLGDPVATLRQAFAELSGSWTSIGVSSLYRTEPVGGVEQDDFTNAVAVFTTDLNPQQVLDYLHKVENEFGRTRDIRWGPRTLDLDLIAMWQGVEPVIMDTEVLTLPHPRAAERAFVTVPWNEIDIPREWKELPGHGSIDRLASAHEQVYRLDERLDT